jgi:transcriptional regulator with XRE-family HTH domain
MTGYSSRAFRLALGRRLRRLRLAAGLTQAALARAAGARPGTYGAWERGRHVPPLWAVVDLALALGTTPDALAGLGGGRGLSRAPTPAAPVRRRQLPRRG